APSPEPGGHTAADLFGEQSTVAGARAATGARSAPRAGAGSLPRCGYWSSGHAEPVALLGAQTDPSLPTFKLTLASLVLVGPELMQGPRHVTGRPRMAGRPGPCLHPRS